jgi:hypothetical protein
LDFKYLTTEYELTNEFLPGNEFFVPQKEKNLLNGRVVDPDWIRI